jgi:hypothetical protein
MDSSEDREWRGRRDQLAGLFNRNELERLRLEGPDTTIGVVYVQHPRMYNKDGNGENDWERGEPCSG